MEILNQVIKPGKTYYLNLDIARLPTRSKLELPVIVRKAKKAGPVVLISAGIHGNEINGIEIVRQFVSKKLNIPDAGTIICVPIVNVFGFLLKSRYFPDGRDLNRVFPGSKKGSLASKFAYEFMNQVVVHADYCIDFHTGGDARFNYSQIRIDDNNEELLSLAKAFGTKFIKLSKTLGKSYRDCAAQQGKKVILFEGGKSLDLDRYVTQSGLKGLVRTLEHLGVKKPTATSSSVTEEPIVFRDSKWIRATYSGMYRSTVKNGAQVTKGDVIGTVSDPYGQFERSIKTQVSGHIICLNHSPIVSKGDAIAHICIDNN